VRQRRSRFLIGVLSAACVALAVVNVVLVTRARTPAPATAPPAAATEAAPAAATDEAPPAPPPLTPSRPAWTDPPVPRHGGDEGRDTARPGPPLEPRIGAAGMPRGDGELGPDRSWPAGAGSADRVATWMVRHHGRAVAEARASAAAAFYRPDDPMHAYWRVVAAHIRRTREGGASAESRHPEDRRRRTP
jgi:hypothetical protein